MLVALGSPLSAPLATIGPARPLPSHADPRSIVREAERAVESRQAPLLAARWNLASKQHPADASALFAQATLERLTYRYPEASRDYELLRAFPASDRRPLPRLRRTRRSGNVLHARAGSEASAASGSALAIARASRDSSAEVLALVNLGILRLRKTSPEVALATFDSAARVVPRRRSRAARAHSLRPRIGARANRARRGGHRGEDGRTARTRGGCASRRRELSARRRQRLRATRPSLRRRSSARHRSHARARARRSPRARDDSPVARLRRVRAPAARFRAAAARRSDRRGRGGGEHLAARVVGAQSRRGVGRARRSHLGARRT